MVATQLRKTALKNVPFSDAEHVVEVITASSAQWVTNYQRYEFPGDSVLKFVVSSQLLSIIKFGMRAISRNVGLN